MFELNGIRSKARKYAQIVFGKNMIIAKSKKDLEKMRAVGELIAEVREALRAMIAPGIRTIELNEAAEKMMRDAGAIPTFIGYAPYGMTPFPYAICASVNEEVVHGFSNERELKEGDIISFDMPEDLVSPPSAISAPAAVTGAGGAAAV